MKKEEYLHIVTDQIRCKKARPDVKTELEAHIMDQMEELQKRRDGRAGGNGTGDPGDGRSGGSGSGTRPDSSTEDVMGNFAVGRYSGRNRCFFTVCLVERRQCNGAAKSAAHVSYRRFFVDAWCVFHGLQYFWKICETDRYPVLWSYDSGGFSGTFGEYRWYFYYDRALGHFCSVGDVSVCSDFRSNSVFLSKCRI